MKMIPVAKPEIGKAERKAVDRVMRSGLLAQGTEVSNFEKEFSKDEMISRRSMLRMQIELHHTHFIHFLLLAFV